MKSHIKAIIIVFIILIIYTFLVYAYASGKKTKNKDPKNDNKVVDPDPNPKPDDSENLSSYAFNIILYPKTKIGYNNGKWYENESFDYNDKYFDVYAKELYKSMKVVYTDRWYIMDDSKKFVDYDGRFAAINSTISYTFVQGNSEVLTSENDAIIKAFLDSQGVKYNYESLQKSVMSFDVNRDGIRDDIYVISNLFLDDYTGFDSTFAFAFVRTLNQNIILHQDAFKDVNALSICNPNLDGILVIDDVPQLILSCSYFSEAGTKHMIYNVEEKKANKLFETKAN